jgi:hypothetical protein
METPQKKRVQKDANLTAPAAAAVSTEHNTTENNTSSASVSEGS